MCVTILPNWHLRSLWWWEERIYTFKVLVNSINIQELNLESCTSNVVLTFEILTCDHSNKSYWAVLSCGAVYYAVQGGSNFWVCGRNPKVWPFKWKLLSSTLLWCCLLCCTRSSNFWVWGRNPKVWPFKWKLLTCTCLWCCLLCCTRRF